MTTYKRGQCFLVVNDQWQSIVMLTQVDRSSYALISLAGDRWAPPCQKSLNPHEWTICDLYNLLTFENDLLTPLPGKMIFQAAHSD